MKNKTQLVEKIANLITDLIHNEAPKDIIVDAVNLSMKLMDYKETKRNDELMSYLYSVEAFKTADSEKIPEGHFDWFEFKECFTFGDLTIFTEAIKYDTKHEMYYYHAASVKDGTFNRRRTYLPVGYGIFDKRDLLEWIRWITWTDYFDLEMTIQKITNIPISFKSNDPYCTFDTYARGHEYITKLFTLNKRVQDWPNLVETKILYRSVATKHHDWDNNDCIPVYYKENK